MSSTEMIRPKAYKAPGRFRNKNLVKKQPENELNGNDPTKVIH